MSLRNIACLAALLASAITQSATASFIVTARFVPPTQTVNLGDTLSVQIVADIGPPVVGWGLDFSIATPSTASQIAPPTIGPAWIPAAAPDGDGLAALAFPNSISGPGILLATLSLHADAIGSTDLILSTTPGDLTEGFALDPTGFATVTYDLGHITVIPEPATASLLLLLAAFMKPGGSN